MHKYDTLTKQNKATLEHFRRYAKQAGQAASEHNSNLVLFVYMSDTHLQWKLNKKRNSASRPNSLLTWLKGGQITSCALAPLLLKQ